MPSNCLHKTKINRMSFGLFNSIVHQFKKWKPSISSEVNDNIKEEWKKNTHTQLPHTKAKQNKNSNRFFPFFSFFCFDRCFMWIVVTLWIECCSLFTNPSKWKWNNKKMKKKTANNSNYVFSIGKIPLNRQFDFCFCPFFLFQFSLFIFIFSVRSLGYCIFESCSNSEHWAVTRQDI